MSVAKGQKLLDSTAHAAIRQAAAEGATLEELEARYGVKRRQLHRIIAAGRPAAELRRERNAKMAHAIIANGESVADVAAAFGVDRSTVWRAWRAALEGRTKRKRSAG